MSATGWIHDLRLDVDEIGGQVLVARHGTRQIRKTAAPRIGNRNGGATRSNMDALDTPAYLPYTRTHMFDSADRSPISWFTLDEVDLPGDHRCWGPGRCPWTRRADPDRLEALGS